MRNEKSTTRNSDSVVYSVVCPADRERVVVEEGGRISIPLSMYDRIGAGPGGKVQMRRVGETLVIERIGD